jgi:hypothetical protein
MPLQQDISGQTSGGARIPNLGILTSTSTKIKSAVFLTIMGENTIKYGGARPRSYFFTVLDCNE